MKKSNKSENYIESDAQEENRTPRPIHDERIGRFGERIKMLVTDEKSRRSFARKTGLGESTVRNYENGERFPDLDVLLAIAEKSGVNLLWLATGEGPKHPEARAGPCESSGSVEIETLRKAVEAVEMMGKDAPAGRKALAIARVYERLIATQGQAEMIEVMRLIQAILADTPYIKESKEEGNVDS